MRGTSHIPALMSQRSWIAEQLHDSDRNLARAPSAAGSNGRAPSSVGSEALTGRVDKHDVHPAVAIVATQGHYYDQMMKAPLELLSSQIVSGVLLAPDEGSLCDCLDTTPKSVDSCQHVHSHIWGAGRRRQESHCFLKVQIQNQRRR